MNYLWLDGSAQQISHRLGQRLPAAPRLPAVKRELLDYQMVALYHLARDFNRPDARLLEIGTGRGGSGYMLAKAAPQARVTSLTVDANAAALATGLWQGAGLTNIKVVVMRSWDYLDGHPESPWDMVFVDGDHNQIARDLPYFDRLRVGGLMLFHDYSPQASPRPSAICHAALDEMARTLGRPFDVRLVDDEKTGMVGFYKRAGEQYATA